ncbi:MAG: hypothetical protein M3046_12530 [Actinomycetota bacterium]|nr:hypothetical protein [Actinomycetota bacterium]
MTGAEIAKRSRGEQGLPPYVEDVDVLARVAALLNAKSAGPNNRRSPKTTSAATDAIAV